MGILRISPLYCQPLDQIWRVVCHIRGIGVVGQTHQVGALFEALNERVLMAPSDLPCHIVQIQRLGYEKNCRRHLRLP